MTPPFLLAIVFGLSMDYEVFLLSRIRERYEATRQAQKEARGELAAERAAGHWTSPDAADADAADADVEAADVEAADSAASADGAGDATRSGDGEA